MTTMPAIKRAIARSKHAQRQKHLAAGRTQPPSQPKHGNAVDTYYMPSAEASITVALPASAASSSTTFLRQGETFLIKVESDQPVTVQAAANLFSLTLAVCRWRMAALTL